MVLIRAIRTVALRLSILCLFALIGCSRSESVPIPNWTYFGPGDPAVTVALTLPAHLEHYVPWRPSTYRLKTVTVLPASYRGKSLTLVIPSFFGLVSLRANGDPVPSLNESTYAIYWAPGPHRFRIPERLTGDERLELELVVDCRWLPAAWIDSVPRLSATSQGDARSVRTYVFNQLSAQLGLWAIVVGAFTYSILYIRGKRNPQYGWFAFGAACGSVYPAFILGYTQPIFGTYDGALLGAAMTMVALTYVKFTHLHCRLGPTHPAWTYCVVVSLILTALTTDVFRPPYLAAPWVMLLLAAAAIYNVSIFVRLCRDGVPPIESWVVLLGLPVSLVITAGDFAVLVAFGSYFDGTRLGPLAVGGAYLMHQVVLSLDYLRSKEQAEMLNLELQSRVALLETRSLEVLTLNEELRRQVSARAEELANVLARVSTQDDGETLLEVGDVVQNRYQILRFVGSGAAGNVYEVVRIVDGRHFALKTLKSGQSPLVLARFAREAQVTAQIHHPNVVTVVDVDVSMTGFLYFVMELVAGDSLRLQRVRFGDIPWALAVLKQMADGLSAIHANGIVHRDLKPGNVLLTHLDDTEIPIVKIADFGISTIGATDAQETIPGSLTRTGVVLGTPLYMAPEANEGSKSARTATDIFSFGVIAYELLTKELPCAELPLGLLLQANIPPGVTALSERVTGVDPDLVRLLDNCLVLNQDARPTAQVLSSAIARALARHQVPSDLRRTDT